MVSNKNIHAVTLVEKYATEQVVNENVTILLIKTVCYRIAYFLPDSLQIPLWFWREVENNRMNLPIFTYDLKTAFQTENL